jgi:hypothetical protein
MNNDFLGIKKAIMKRIVVIIAFCFFLYGCYSIAFFQSPKVLEKGKTEFSFGTSLVYSNNYLSLYELFGNLRVGVGNNADVGIRIFGKPPRDLEFLKEGGSSDSCEGGCWVGIYVDGKYQLVEEPLYISTVLGLSYSFPAMAALYPSIVIGTERFYLVSRIIIFGPIGFWEEGSEFAKYVMASPSMSMGFLVGRKVRLLPEVGILLSVSEKGFSPNFYTSLGISF